MKRFLKVIAALALSLGIITGVSVPGIAPVQNVAYAKTYSLRVTSSHLNVKRGQYASVTVKGKPRSVGTLTLIYKSGRSKAQHLQNIRSSKAGYITWRWKVGTRTTKGYYRVTIKLGGRAVTPTLHVR